MPEVHLATFRALLSERGPLARPALDFSARAPIRFDPALAPGRCALPRPVARELWKLHLCGALLRDGLAGSPSSALALWQADAPEARSALARLAQRWPVLLLPGRTGPDARPVGFSVELTEGSAVALGPLSWRLLGPGPRDGSVRVFLPLSPGARREVRCRLRASGAFAERLWGPEPVLPAAEALVGLLLGTTAEGGPAGGSGFGSIDEVQAAHESGHLGLRQRVRLRSAGAWAETTAGRCLLAQACQQPELAGELWPLTGERVLALLRSEGERWGEGAAMRLCQRLEAWGWQIATRAGWSVGMDDLAASTEIALPGESLNAALVRIEDQYDEGLLTYTERLRLKNEAWRDEAERIEDAVTRLPAGSLEQAAKATGERGLPQRLRGAIGIVERPWNEEGQHLVLQSLGRGLSAHSFWACAEQERRTRLERTLRLGFLERRWLGRLTRALGAMRVVAGDCGGACLPLPLPPDIGWAAAMFEGRLVGFDVQTLLDGVTLASDGQRIDRTLLRRLIGAGVDQIAVRSPLACDRLGHVCAACAGEPPSAAMRHAPGAQIARQLVRLLAGYRRAPAPEPWSWPDPDQAWSCAARREGIVHLGSTRWVVEAGEDRRIVVPPCGSAEVCVVDDDGRVLQRQRLPEGAELLVEPRQRVAVGQPLARKVDPHPLYVSPVDGIVRWIGLTEESLRAQHVDGKFSHWMVWSTPGDRAVGVAVETASAMYATEVVGNEQILFGEGQQIRAGEVLLRVPESARTALIEPRTSAPSDTESWREALAFFSDFTQKTDDLAVVAPCAGTVRIDQGHRGDQHVFIERPNAQGVAETHWGKEIPWRRRPLVGDGERVWIGTRLTDGVRAVGEEFEQLGPLLTSFHLMAEMAQAGLRSSAPMTPALVELLAREMTMSFVEVDDESESQLWPGARLHRLAAERHGRALQAQGEDPLETSPVLVGLSALAALRRRRSAW